MDGMTIVWIVVAVVVVIFLIALIAGAVKKSKERRIEHDRQEAYEHEQQAKTAAMHAEKQQAAADEVDARSRKAQAIADEKAAEARRLAAGANERREAAEHARADSDDHRTHANTLNPDAGRSDDRTPTEADGRTSENGRSEDDKTPHAASWGAATAPDEQVMAGATDEQPIDRKSAEPEQPQSDREARHAARRR
ncbi:MAG: hypothetical protein QOF10_1939 [Kribbellaceae bacterium]|jgi:type II secretory pathway pseudopilin PulG|nr:hypothetical protein [Kribbellaceae bacterium]